jgi:cytochrome bd-type quinol oxidase subunit 2
LGDVKRTLYGLAVFFLFGLLALGLSSIGSAYLDSPEGNIPYALRMYGVSLLVAGVSFVFGGFLGFVFGVPKSAAETQGFPTDTSHQVQKTNLEQISNWLTTVIVGLGLTQVLTIPGSVWSVAKTIAESFDSGSTILPVIFVSLLVYFFIIGLFSVYYLARTFIPLSFQRIEEELEKRRNMFYPLTESASAIREKFKRQEETGTE